MTKNLFKWMMALALVATPVFFTACGDDDTSSSSDNQKTFIDFTVSESVGGEITVLSEIRANMLTAMCQSVGQTFDPGLGLGLGYAIRIAASDESKMLEALDAAYEKLKDTDTNGGHLTMKLSKEGEVVRTYTFGKNEETQSYKVYIGFENQQLNDQNFWIGDSVGKFTYKEDCATVTGTQGVYNGTPYWSGFAISGRKENTYANLTPDQYNQIAKGGTYFDNQFLVVQNAYNDYECITFDKPMTVMSMYCGNSAYTYNSMTVGDSIVGGPFTADDWFSGYIICLNEQGDTISKTEVELAKKGEADIKKKYIEWHAVRIQSEHVKKITFTFDGSRKNEWGLTTPAYMCVDRLYLVYE